MSLTEREQRLQIDRLTTYISMLQNYLANTYTCQKDKDQLSRLKAANLLQYQEISTLKAYLDATKREIAVKYANTPIPSVVQLYPASDAVLLKSENTALQTYCQKLASDCRRLAHEIIALKAKDGADRFQASAVQTGGSQTGSNLQLAESAYETAIYGEKSYILQLLQMQLATTQNELSARDDRIAQLTDYASRSEAQIAELRCSLESTTKYGYATSTGCALQLQEQAEEFENERIHLQQQINARSVELDRLYHLCEGQDAALQSKNTQIQELQRLYNNAMENEEMLQMYISQYNNVKSDLEIKTQQCRSQYEYIFALYELCTQQQKQLMESSKRALGGEQGEAVHGTYEEELDYLLEKYK